jgi:predicted transport protein
MEKEAMSLQDKINESVTELFTAYREKNKDNFAHTDPQVVRATVQLFIHWLLDALLEEVRREGERDNSYFIGAGDVFEGIFDWLVENYGRQHVTKATEEWSEEAEAA